MTNDEKGTRPQPAKAPSSIGHTRGGVRYLPAAAAKPSAISHSSLVIGHFPPAPAFLPTGYISDPQTRIQAYRRLAEINAQELLDQLRKTWRDRFGPLPAAAENLLTLSEIKLAAMARKISRVEVKDGKLMLTRGGDYILLGGKFPRLSPKPAVESLRETLEMIRSF